MSSVSTHKRRSKILKASRSTPHPAKISRKQRLMLCRISSRTFSRRSQSRRRCLTKSSTSRYSRSVRPWINSIQKRLNSLSRSRSTSSTLRRTHVPRSRSDPKSTSSEVSYTTLCLLSQTSFFSRTDQGSITMMMTTIRC